VDLKARTVNTIAGTGEQLRQRFLEGAARETNLSSPWDVLLEGNSLFIAMAGPHQIWRMDLTTNRVSLFAGSPQWREARADGARLESAFAQPSGLASDGKTLYVADSESNIIRAVDLAPAEGEVVTLAGGDLFEFGDRDGAGDRARLQHPLGVVFHNGAIFIADTYNHKIKRLDPQTRAVETFAGTGKPGQLEGAQSSFHEPGGLSIANGKLYIADTNNHAIRILDTRTKQVSTLAIKNLRAPETAIIAAAENDMPVAPNKDEIALAPQVLNTNSESAFLINVRLPEGYHLNELAPHRLDAIITKGAERLTFAGNKPTFKLTTKDLHLPVQLPLTTKATGAGEVRVALTLYYCRTDNTGACRIKTLRWRVPLDVKTNAGAGKQVQLAGEIKL
jgi:DNA-binding beta-propeller fold protein YncE